MELYQDWFEDRNRLETSEPETQGGGSVGHSAPASHEPSMRERNDKRRSIWDNGRPSHPKCRRANVRPPSRNLARSSRREFTALALPSRQGVLGVRGNRAAAGRHRHLRIQIVRRDASDTGVVSFRSAISHPLSALTSFRAERDHRIDFRSATRR